MSNSPEAWYEARESIIDYVEDDLMGPKDSVLTSAPLTRILIGILYPQEATSKHVESQEDSDPILDVVSTDSESKTARPDESPEQEVSLSHQSRPSSMGLTFAVGVRSKTQNILVTPSALRYQENDQTDAEDKTWSPIHVEPQKPIVINIRGAEQQRIHREVVEGSDGKLELVTIIRPPLHDRIRITVTLVNCNSTGDFTGKKDAYCWFRPFLKVQTDEDGFVDGRPDSDFRPQSHERQAMDFLYRSRKLLAQGHGCSPYWDESASEVSEITSTFLPQHEVPLSSAEAGGKNDPFGSFDLNMGKIAHKSGRGELAALADAYSNWIETKRKELHSENGLTEAEIKIGESNLEQAHDCLTRIRIGIESLVSPQISEAFKLMNLAMIRQRDAQDAARGYGSSDAVKAPEDAYITRQKWRPFQIAFILMNLPGLADRDHSDRGIADLLWFPTGGGKTEAYLGCIGFSIIYRRLQNPHDGGVSAIMRYTLRILTTDQFIRAAGLICALELVRRDEIPQSSEEISLGLWVGDATSHNRLEEAERELNRLKAGTSDPKESKLLQIKRCPHCGTPIQFEDYAFPEKGLIISCPNRSCAFSDGLPLYIIDDDVYSKRPSLIIGTVDKFAQMTWKSEVSRLLSLDKKFSTPDLIVQDELHLISGPLGTMVGLYESALDLALSSIGDSQTKVIASTATIRRADEQVRSVFNRSATQFPPPGLDPNDNYFSKTAPRETTGTREYVGVIAPGTSQATLLVRLYAALLQAASSVDAPAEVIDAYWTLLGYFNSLRVLGSTYLQVVDDIPRRIDVIAQRQGEEKRASSSSAPLELTSRVSAGQILTMREQMETSYPDPASPNVVLATNMISVGLDIDRLGLMVVAGQPQNTSEYIQATSRVGRKRPGLVVVAFNAQRSRDVSHFESFIPFHRSLYRSVEATTATPFAARARDRGAHGVLVAATRMIIDGMRGDEDASQIAEYENEVRERVIAPLVERAQAISPEDAAPLKARLNSLLAAWLSAAEVEADDDSVQKYGSMGSKESPRNSLLKPAGTEDGPDRFDADVLPWETLTSLRDVDAETTLYLKGNFRRDK